MGIYEENLAVISLRYPDTARLLESIEIDDGEFKTVLADDGNYGLLRKVEGDEYAFINTGADQTERVRETISQFGGTGSGGIVFLFGFTLGHFADALVTNLGTGFHLFVYEAIPGLFKVALRTRDITSLLKREDLHIFVGEDIDNFSAFTSCYKNSASEHLWVVKDDPSVNICPEVYERFYARLLREKRLADTDETTLRTQGKKFANAYMSNIPSILTNNGVDKLKGIFSGRPAVLVAAGPSIDKNFHLLRQLKGKAIVIAVDAVLPTILPYGIIPDIIVAIDPGDENIIMFSDTPLLRDIPLICTGQYTPEVVRIYPGPLFFNGNPGNVVNQWFAPFLPDKGQIEYFGGSVAHFAFSVAEYIGCNVISIMGQDLSYHNDSYTKGYSDLIKPAETDNAAPDTDISVPAVNIFGETVRTYRQFQVYKISFEHKIKDYNGVVVNSTEGGVPINGAAVMRLADFIDEYCKDTPVIDTLSIISGLVDKDVTYDVGGILANVISGRDKLEELKRIAARILKTVEKGKTLHRRGKHGSLEFNAILRKLDALGMEIKHPMHNLIATYHYDLHLDAKRYNAFKAGNAADETIVGKFGIAEKYYNAVIVAIDIFNEQLNSLVSRLHTEKDILDVLADESLNRYEKALNAGSIYRKTSMARKSVKYLEMARTTASSRANDHYLQISLAKMYLKQFRFYEAMGILAGITIEDTPLCGNACTPPGNKRKSRQRGRKKAAGESLPSQVAKLRKVCSEKINKWEGRKEEMEELARRAAAAYGSRQESIDFYSRLDGCDIPKEIQRKYFPLT